MGSPDDDPAGTARPKPEALRRPTGGFPRLIRRADFQRVAKGRTFHAAVFSLQAARRPDSGAHGPAPRFGLTVTRKTGGAVERNRIRRRLREVLRSSSELAARPDHDYVIVARRAALTAPFAQLIEELGRAMQQIHRPRPQRGGRDQRRGTGQPISPSRDPHSTETER